MITWDNFYLFALPAIVLWGAGAVFALFSKERSRWAIGLTLSGILVFAAFITGFWLSLQRPPLRTMGETRLWYSFFMGISGLLTYLRWKYPWILSFSTVVGAVFAIINILKPEIHDQYNPQIQISAESETKRSIFREKDKTKRSKKESAQHSKSRNKSFVMTSVSAL